MPLGSGRRTVMHSARRDVAARRGFFAGLTPHIRDLKEVFRRFQFATGGKLIGLINPMLRGWVNYFAVGHSSECFCYIKDWVEKKVRRHMLRAQKRKGFSWTQWSRRRLYDDLKLFNGYRVRRPQPKVAPG
jgi:RNA-directed DNA polymerase